MESHKASKKTTDENDEDQTFFHSLLPTVKSLSMDKKFTFRIQTMQLLQNLKRPTLTTNTLSNVTTPLSSSALSYYSQFPIDELSNEYTNM